MRNMPNDNDISSNSNNDFDLYSMSTRGNKKRKRRMIRRVVNVLASIVLVMSLLTTSAMGYYLFMAGSTVGGLEKENESDQYEELTVSKHSGVSYILVLGVDPQESLTDIMAVACIDHEKNTINILQIPRDLFIGTDIPTSKMNAVYSNPRKGEAKINALRRRLTSYLGVPLDHYVLFTIKGFIKVIDSLGGLKINITQENGVDIMNPNTLKHKRVGPGWVTLNGEWATGFVRKRTGTSDGYYKGDIDRIEAQRLVYVALAKKLKNMGVSQMLSVATNCYSQIATDMTVNEILGYANEAKSIPMSSIGVYAIPGQSCTYKGLSMYSIHKDDYISIFNTYLNPYGDPVTNDSLGIRELHTMIGVPTRASDVDPGTKLSDVETKENQ